MARLVLVLLSLFLLINATQAKLRNPLDIEQLETKGYGYFQSIKSPRDDESINYRLPNNSIPVHYDVELWTTVNTGERAFNGIVNIELQVLEDTRTIVLHARQTENFVATIIRTDGTGTAEEIALETSYDSTLEFLSLTPESEDITFPQDTFWLLTIKYNGTLRTDNGGFYLSYYTDDNDEIHYIATTQFESTNARHAFPCYDEPAKRATFTITINHAAEFTAISNMPVDEEKSSSGITVFQKTVKMSTYLVAFIVSDFEYTEGELNGLPQRIYTRKGTQDQQEWALWSGLIIESKLAEYYGVPFALPKLDQAALPHFSAGAMENWGLATYREEYMLWTKESSTINYKRYIANIIGHEYTHMWFGNLVSIKWWTYLWLKEGFATIFSYESNDLAYPEWDTYQLFHVSDYNNALIGDAALTATPMTHYVQTPSEISNRYNTFSYAKPSAVIYMFKNAWTDKVFRLGMNKYLTTNQFESCDEWDLFESLQQAADESDYKLPDTVANIFSSWSKQGGFPVLTVERNYDDGSFTVKQQHYTDDKDYNGTKIWYVPFNYAVQSKPDFRDTSASHYISESELSVSDAKLDSSDWLILNKQSSGYYRILYDDRNLELISEGLIAEPFKVHTRNRAQLLHDTYRFVATERTSQAALLKLMSYLKNEDQYAPWSIANSIFTVYDQYLRGDSDYDEFRYYVVELVEDIFDKLGVNEVSGEHFLNNYLRVVLINLACLVGSEKCYEQANNKLKQFLEDGIIIEPTLMTQTYCAGLRSSGDDVYNKVFDLLLASTVATDRSLYISSLGCSQTASQIKKFIESSLDDSNSLTTSERTSLLSASYSRGEIGLTASLDFLDSNWEAYGGLSESKPLDSAIRGMAAYVVSEGQKARLEKLVETVSSSELVNSGLSTSVNASIAANFAWLDTHRDPLISWIKTYRKPEGDGSSMLSASLTGILAATVLVLSKIL